MSNYGKNEGNYPHSEYLYKITAYDFKGSNMEKSTEYKDLIIIGNDIIYETNNSDFIKGDDYRYIFEL